MKNVIFGTGLLINGGIIVAGSMIMGALRAPDDGSGIHLLFLLIGAVISVVGLFTCLKGVIEK